MPGSSESESTAKIRGPVLVHRGPRPGSRPVIKSCMKFTWTEVLPASIRSLPPLHQETVAHVMEVPGKKHRSSAHARRASNLDRDEAWSCAWSLRLCYGRYGINSAAD